jgi:hypothetical protein
MSSRRITIRVPEAVAARTDLDLHAIGMGRPWR